MQLSSLPKVKSWWIHKNEAITLVRKLKGNLGQSSSLSKKCCSRFSDETSETHLEAERSAKTPTRGGALGERGENLESHWLRELSAMTEMFSTCTVRYSRLWPPVALGHSKCS